MTAIYEMACRIIKSLIYYWPYIGFSFLILLISGIKLSDKYYYYNKENVRYTIGKYKKKGRSWGKNSGTYYLFTYIVEGKEYNSSTSSSLSQYNLDSIRFIIRYSAVQLGYSNVITSFVPSFIIAPPKEGWREYPPDINWKGAVIDTLAMDSVLKALPR